MCVPTVCRARPGFPDGRMRLEPHWNDGFHGPWPTARHAALTQTPSLEELGHAHRVPKQWVLHGPCLTGVEIEAQRNGLTSPRPTHKIDPAQRSSIGKTTLTLRAGPWQLKPFQAPRTQPYPPLRPPPRVVGPGPWEAVKKAK